MKKYVVILVCFLILGSLTARAQERLPQGKIHKVEPIKDSKGKVRFEVSYFSIGNSIAPTKPVGTVYYGDGDSARFIVTDSVSIITGQPVSTFWILKDNGHIFPVSGKSYHIKVIIRHFFPNDTIIVSSERDFKN